MIGTEESVKYLEGRMRNRCWFKFGARGTAGEIWDVERTDRHED